MFRVFFQWLCRELCPPRCAQAVLVHRFLALPTGIASPKPTPPSAPWCLAPLGAALTLFAPQPGFTVQGNADWYTDKALAARHALKSEAAIEDAVQEWWR